MFFPPALSLVHLGAHPHVSSRPQWRDLGVAAHDRLEVTAGNGCGPCSRWFGRWRSREDTPGEAIGQVLDWTEILRLWVQDDTQRNMTPRTRLEAEDAKAAGLPEDLRQ